MKTELILCSTLAPQSFGNSGAAAPSPAGPPVTRPKPESADDPGCCDIPVKPATIGDNSGSTANETGGKPGDDGPG